MEKLLNEGYQGIGRRERRRMIRRWRAECASLPAERRATSLKEWARNAGVGDAAAAWIRNKGTDMR